MIGFFRRSQGLPWKKALDIFNVRISLQSLRSSVEEKGRENSSPSMEGGSAQGLLHKVEDLKVFYED